MMAQFPPISRYAARRSIFLRSRTSQSRFYGTKTSKPLRVLFCGSDDFSSASLRALHAEQNRDANLIASIDVVCRPGKRSGRYMKNIREVPVKAVAQELGLPIHERDTFTGWDLPRPVDGEPINLIIAVSFGLFIPPRILRAAEYGGLNVHPSLLPNFRGPAPLQHTVLAGKTHTGVTLQTLDEKNFDNGIILAQTPHPGFTIPSPSKYTYATLLEFVTPKAADILIQGLRNRVFVPPLVDVGDYKTDGTAQNQHAPKITPQDRQIDWLDWSAETIERRHRGIGRLWNNVWLNMTTSKRFVFEDIEMVPRPGLLANWVTLQTQVNHEDGGNDNSIHFMGYSTIGGQMRPRVYVSDGDAIIVAASCDKAVRIKEITVDGDKRKSARKVMESTREAGLWWSQKKWHQELLETGPGLPA